MCADKQRRHNATTSLFGMSQQGTTTTKAHAQDAVDEEINAATKTQDTIDEEIDATDTDKDTDTSEKCPENVAPADAEGEPDSRASVQDKNKVERFSDRQGPIRLDNINFDEIMYSHASPDLGRFYMLYTKLRLGMVSHAYPLCRKAFTTDDYVSEVAYRMIHIPNFVKQKSPLEQWDRLASRCEHFLHKQVMVRINRHTHKLAIWRLRQLLDLVPHRTRHLALANACRRIYNFSNPDKMRTVALPLITTSYVMGAGTNGMDRYFANWSPHYAPEVPDLAYPLAPMQPQNETDEAIVLHLRRAGAHST